MTYLTLDDIKRQCIIEESFTEDDDLLEALGDAAEDFVQSHINQQLDDVAADNAGDLPKSLKQAMLIMCDYLYDNRGSGDNHEIPDAFYVLCKPYMHYTIL